MRWSRHNDVMFEFIVIFTGLSMFEITMWDDSILRLSISTPTDVVRLQPSLLHLAMLPSLLAVHISRPRDRLSIYAAMADRWGLQQNRSVEKMHLSRLLQRLIYKGPIPAAGYNLAITAHNYSPFSVVMPV